jgi:nucleotide-binding universal stress UspA family protein
LYKRIVLAYDGSHEGRIALREGALLAKQLGAQVFLLSVAPDTTNRRWVEGAAPGSLAQEEETFRSVFEDGKMRLERIGLKPQARMVRGEPAREIAAWAHEVAADLVVVSLRRQGAWSRWWSGDTGAFLSDSVGCSILVARSMMSDPEFDQEIQRIKAPA